MFLSQIPEVGLPAVLPGHSRQNLSPVYAWESKCGGIGAWENVRCTCLIEVRVFCVKISQHCHCESVLDGHLWVPHPCLFEMFTVALANSFSCNVSVILGNKSLLLSLYSPGFGEPQSATGYPRHASWGGITSHPLGRPLRTVPAEQNQSVTGTVRTVCLDGDLCCSCWGWQLLEKAEWHKTL